MKKKLLTLSLLLLATALIPVASAEIIRESRIHVGSQRSGYYAGNSGHSVSKSRCSRCGHSYPVRRVISGHCRAGRPVYSYVRAGKCGCRTNRYHSNRSSYRGYHSNRSSCRSGGSYIRIRL